VEKVGAGIAFRIAFRV